MGSGRLRRTRSKNVEVQTESTETEQTLQGIAVRDASMMMPPRFESAHSLLLSSLRFWEVERDLIEERIAALRSLTVPLRDNETRMRSPHLQTARVPGH